MIVVRNIFQLKFGKARDAIAILSKGADRYRRLGVEMRLLTDVTGPFYTLVMELPYPTLAAFEASMSELAGDAGWRASHQELAPLVQSGRREILRIVE